MVNIFVAPNGKIPTWNGKLVDKRQIELLQQNCGMREAELLQRAFAGVEMDWRYEWQKSQPHN